MPAGGGPRDAAAVEAGAGAADDAAAVWERSFRPSSLMRALELESACRPSRRRGRCAGGSAAAAVEAEAAACAGGLDDGSTRATAASIEQVVDAHATRATQERAMRHDGAVVPSVRPTADQSRMHPPPRLWFFWFMFATAPGPAGSRAQCSAHDGGEDLYRS